MGSVHRIEIIVTDRGGAKRVARDVRAIGPAADRASAKARNLTQTLRQTATVTRDLRNLFIILGAARITKGLVTATDEFKQMKNTLKGFDVGAKNIESVRKKVVGIANASRTGAKETAVFFGRLKKATKDLGLSNTEVLKLTGTAQKALRLGGASSTEATQAVRQLSQAFNKGKLDGDEFRSVLENAPILAELLSKELGVTKSVLRDLAEDGKISTEVLVAALQNGADKIDQRFGTLQTTFGDVATKIRNNVVEYIGSVDEASGVSAKFINVLNEFADNVGPNVEAAMGAMAVASVAFAKSFLLIGKRLAPFLLAVKIFEEIDAQIREATDGARGLSDVFRDINFGIAIAVDAIGDMIDGLNVLAGIDFLNIKNLVDGLASTGGNTVMKFLADATNISKFFPDGAFDNLVNPEQAALIKSLQGQKIMQSGLIQGLLKSGDLDEGVTVAQIERRAARNQAPFGRTAVGLRENAGEGFFSGTVQTDAGIQLNKLVKTALAAAIVEAQISSSESLIDMNADSGGSATRSGQLKRFKDLSNQRELLKTGDELKSIMGDVTEILDLAADKQNALAVKAAAVATSILTASEKFAPEKKLEQTKELIASMTPILKDLEKISGSEAILKAEVSKTASTIKKELARLAADADKLTGQAQTDALAKLKSVTERADVIMKAASDNTVTTILAAYEKLLARLEAAAASVGAVTLPTPNANAGNKVDPFATPGAPIIASSGTEKAPYEGEGSTVADELDKQTESLQRLREELQATNFDQAKTFGNMSRNTKQFGDQLGSFAKDLQGTFTSVFSSLEDALVSFVTTGKFDFKKLVNAMLADLARLLIRMLIIRPLMGFFGGLFGFSGGGIVPGFSGGGFASAGSLGSTGGGSGFSCANGSCNLPGFAAGSGVVAGYGGSRSDNQLARLSPGEFVMNAQDTRRNLPELRNMNNGGGSKRAVSGNTVVNNISTTVNVQGGGGSGKDDEAARARTIAKAVDQQIEKQLTEFARRETRSGGMLERTGR